MDNNEFSAGSSGANGSDVSPLPPVSFSTFVLSLNSSALVHLGEIPMPGATECEVDISMARHSIDVLAMLEEKTRGNLTEDEANLLKRILYELRMKFLAATR